MPGPATDDDILGFARGWEIGGREGMAGVALEDADADAFKARLVAVASPLLEEIVLFFQFDRFFSAEAFRIGKQIERQIAPLRPVELAELRFATGSDSTGDPGLWVWAFVAETGEHDEEVFFRAVDKIEPVLMPASRAVAPEGRVYLYFRSTLDQLEVEGVAA